jgi:hypothetical protein
MEIKGYWGFKKDGEMKMTFCQFDSFVGDDCGLGDKVLDFVKKYSKKELNEIFKNIVMVPSDEKAIDTPKAEKYSWYRCALKGAQITPESYAEGLKYMLESVDYKNGENCYIIDLDTNELKMYCCDTLHEQIVKIK